MKAKDAKNLKEYNIEAYTKGIVVTSILNNITTKEFYQFNKIYNIIHHPNIGIEIVNFNGTRKVFYHDKNGESQYLFDIIHSTLIDWYNSNKN